MTNWKWIKFCSICGIDYAPKRGSWEAATNLCVLHRDQWYKELYKKKYLFERLPYRKALRYKVWLAWVKKNWERRKKIALDSYHRRKNEPHNKMRKHRATKKPLT